MTTWRVELDELGTALPKATLLVSSDGTVLDVNEQVQRLLGFTAADLRAQPLSQFVTTAEDELRRMLSVWSSSTQPTPAVLTWRRREAEPVGCWCTGAVARRGTPSVIVVQVQPQKAAHAQFAVLNQKIVELNAEIRARREAEGELRNLNARLEREVERRTEELHASNEELRRRNEELRDFAHAASHDLQDPLRKIAAFSELLQQGYTDQLDAEGAFYVERMHEMAGRMGRLIHDLLALSRTSATAQPPEAVPLDRIVADVLDSLSVRIEETAGQIEVGPLPVVPADPTQMHQLFQNLIANALKFHRPDVPPHVHVQGRPDVREGQGAGWSLTVEDNGIGFDEKYLDRIFAPFQRLHDPQAYEGTGIGLAICRRIVERHGGSLNAQSTEGQGSRFTVWLPTHPG